MARHQLCIIIIIIINITYLTCVIIINITYLTCVIHLIIIFYFNNVSNFCQSN